MMERSDVFTDEFIVDEMLGFFGGATETTHNVLQTVLTHLMQNKKSLEKVRAEFDKVLDSHIKEDPKLANATKSEQLNKAVSVDSCFDFEYLNWTTMEGLRFQPPGSITPVVFD